MANKLKLFRNGAACSRLLSELASSIGQILRVELPHLALRPCTAEVFVEQRYKFSAKIDPVKTVSSGNPNAFDDGLHVISEAQGSVNLDREKAV